MRLSLPSPPQPAPPLEVRRPWIDRTICDISSCENWPPVVWASTLSRSCARTYPLPFGSYAVKAAESSSRTDVASCSPPCSTPSAASPEACMADAFAEPRRRTAACCTIDERRVAFHLAAARWYSCSRRPDSRSGVVDKLRPTTHGWRRSDGASRRERGSACSSRSIRSIASPETPSHCGDGNSTRPCWIALRICASVRPGASKGWLPERTMYRMTPSDHMSTSRPLPRVAVKHSGAQYAQVPCRSCDASRCAASPRSHTLIVRGGCSPSPSPPGRWSAPESSRFSGLRSRWHTPSAWRWAIASPTWRKRAEACCSEYAPYCPSRSNSSPPPTYSITSAQPPSVSYTPRSSTMLRWRPARRMISTSRRTSDGGRFAAPPPPDLLLRLDAICFTATTSPVSRCRARRTVAKWPRPISSPSS
mmetsp:Transcript_19504/g.62847  ORF Transcript_19504/g.62847 Transcript_19504/m.62847 type:complete len:420 (+) Transcript_19504:260-1519(+)